MTPVEQIFAWIEHTPLSQWVRGDWLLAFPTILTLHTIGMGIVAGIGAITALRVLGFPAAVPPAAMEKFQPVFWAGFAVNAASGVLLFIGYPYKAATNPLFYVKLSCIALGIYLAVRIRNEVLRAGVIPPHAKILASLSIAAWVSAIAAGRLLAYTYTWLLVGLKPGF